MFIVWMSSNTVDQCASAGPCWRLCNNKTRSGRHLSSVTNSGLLGECHPTSFHLSWLMITSIPHTRLDDVVYYKVYCNTPRRCNENINNWGPCNTSAPYFPLMMYVGLVWIAFIETVGNENDLIKEKWNEKPRSMCLRYWEIHEKLKWLWPMWWLGAFGWSEDVWSERGSHVKLTVATVSSEV